MGVLATPYDEDRAWRVTHDVLRDRTDESALEARATVRAHHDEVAGRIRGDFFDDAVPRNARKELGLYVRDSEALDLSLCRGERLLRLFDDACQQLVGKHHRAVLRQERRLPDMDEREGSAGFGRHPRRCHHRLVRRLREINCAQDPLERHEHHRCNTLTTLGRGLALAHLGAVLPDVVDQATNGLPSVTIRPDRQYRAFAWFAFASVLGSAIVLWPLAPWVVLAMWMAALARRVHRPVSRYLGDRPRLAAVLTMAILALFLGPAVVLLTLLVADAIDLVQRLMASERTQEIFRELVSSSDGSSQSPSDLVGLVMSQGGRAWAVGQQIAGTAARMVIGLVTLIAGTYAVLVDGERWYLWIENHAPIPASALRRLAGAFLETGRGLLVGIGGAGLAQSIVATIVYASIGVPQALALGLLTLVFSVVPAVGTAMVWIPVVAGLAVTGRSGAAVVLLIAGVAVIGTIDNLVRPYLARRGKLQLPTYVVLVAMFGGIMIMGGWGVLIAPLVVRLAKEALSILRDERTRPAGSVGNAPGG